MQTPIVQNCPDLGTVATWRPLERVVIWAAFVPEEEGRDLCCCEDAAAADASKPGRGVDKGISWSGGDLDWEEEEEEEERRQRWEEDLWSRARYTRCIVAVLRSVFKP